MAADKITKFIDEIKTLTVLELAELVKAIEEEFGVTAVAPVMVAAAGGGAVRYPRRRGAMRRFLLPAAGSAARRFAVDRPAARVVDRPGCRC